MFLDGNNLPGNWQGRDFTIGETGFGTGLNFLCAWRLWNETNPGHKLHFISVEKYPLSPDEIAAALEPWRGEFVDELDALLANYPEDCSGTKHIAMGEHCRLTLSFGDANDELPKWTEPVDCWFLDGFKPKKNPDMWTEIVFSNMARLSGPGATLATFTAAGFVRRGLAEAGFTVQRIKGYGTKWHMVTGVKL